MLVSEVGPIPRPHVMSLQALDWLNFFLAALLMGLGPFVAVKLTDHGWMPEDIGLILTASGLAGLFTQVPAGELIDMSRSKRMLVGIGTVAITIGVSIVGLRSDFPSVFAAALIQGVAGSVLGPGIAAVSLGLVGREALPNRLGRNQRFASIGGLSAAAVMGIIGYASSTQEIFLVTAAFGVPVLLALARIRGEDIHFARACCAPVDDAASPQRVSRTVLFKDRRLLIFAICLFLFQVANASILPLAGEKLVHADGRWSSLVTSALIVIPQIFVALLAPWTGRTADTWGRRPLLLIGLGAVPIRAAFLSVTANPTLMIAIQALDGLSGAALGVLTTLVISDLASGTGRFNLAQGLVGTISGTGASLSSSISGLVVERFGSTIGFLGLTTVGLIGVAIFWMFMPETRPPMTRSSMRIDPTAVTFDAARPD